MGKVVDLTGRQFGRLTVVEFAGKTAIGKILWLCVCDCGTIKKIMADNLRSGSTKSCGCLLQETRKEANYTHKQSGTRLYRVWRGILARCYNQNQKAYVNYGGRGITMCDEWRNDFLTFSDWAKNSGYSEGLSIDRTDNNKGYFPENCRWTTSLQQNNNRRDNHVIEYKGKTQSLSAWAREMGINIGTLQTRVYKGLAGEDLFKPVERGNVFLFEHTGKLQSLTMWEKETGIDRHTIARRIQNGADFSMIFHKGRVNKAKEALQYE